MNNYRRTEAWNKRNEANELASRRVIPRHESNDDELRFRHEEEDLKNPPSYLMSFTKGMPHNFDTGLLTEPLFYKYFVRAIDSGDPRDFRDVPLGPPPSSGAMSHCGSAWSIMAQDYPEWESEKARTGGKNGGRVGFRAWESQSAGLAFDLQGPDAQAVTMPPAPRLGSPELTAEMAEVYAQALSRDWPLHALSAGVIKKEFLGHKKCNTIPQAAIQDQTILDDLNTDKQIVDNFRKLTEQLKKLDWFSDTALKLNEQETIRRCDRQCPTPADAFRGITPGDDIGPYLSQFLLIGNTGINRNLVSADRDPSNGLITYGAITINQKVRTAKAKNYMTKWEQWFDVQNAANVSGLEEYVERENPQAQRFIYTGRDLATYVHYDALYQAYLNACLILIAKGVPFDPGIPFQEEDNRDHQQGFAHFGGPHILSLVTEVATRALKAVRFQKYNIHRRCRPEVLAARITKAEVLEDMAPELMQMRKDIGTNSQSILGQVNSSNGRLFESENSTDRNYLLPMAFCEGSPMHPAYGAGHATVAGACVTILKAFFDCKQIFKANGKDADKAYVSVKDGTELDLIPIYNKWGEKAHLTVEGELNKLASNISIGRDWAGVHYFTDYYESILMGEEIAIGILEEQKLMFGENFSMTLPLFGGGSIRI